MPNGGTDCCASCWFNAVNGGERSPIGPKVPTTCTIRHFSIDDPLHTYCANHPKRRRERDAIPIGPVFFGDDSGARHEGVPSPDGEEIRFHLLKLLAEMTEEPATEYPMGSYVDETVVYQLGRFKEQRAVDDLRRVAAFEPGTKERGPFRRTRRLLVQLAKDAIEQIEHRDGV